MEAVLKKDLSLLTTVKEPTINKWNSIIAKIICDYVEEAIKTDQEYIKIDLGWAYLTIYLLEGEIKYVLTPSEELEANLIETVVEKKSPLVLSLEESLVEKFQKIYKDIL